MTTAVLVASPAVAVTSSPPPKAVPGAADADEIRSAEDQAAAANVGADENATTNHANANTTNANDAPTTTTTTNTNANANAPTSVTCAAADRLKRSRVASSTESLPKRRRVSFESAEIVEFEPTVFTTTVTSGGIPVGMSLTERSRSRRRLDSWELEREDLRVGRQSYMEEGYLDPAERELILNNAGCAEQSMLSVEAEVNQIIAHRRESNEVDFDFLYGLVSIGEEEDEAEEEEDEEDEDEEEEEEAIEEVQLLTSLVQQVIEAREKRQR